MYRKDLFESSNDKAITMAPPLPSYFLTPPTNNNNNNNNKNNNNNNNDNNSNNNNNINSNNNNNSNGNNSNNNRNTNNNNTPNTNTTSYTADYSFGLEGDFRYWKYLCKSSKKFDTITDAIKDAKPYSFIHIRPGVYEDNFVVNKPVHIIGIGGMIPFLIEKRRGRRGEKGKGGRHT
jgi:hypothetical protein